MECLFVEYPKCTTCQKAKKWLEERQTVFADRHIREQNPTSEELKEWHERSGLDIKRFFNTSGMVYKELKLKDRLPQMTLEEKYELLATDGMLVKRPILVTERGVTTGFKPEEWEKLLG
ncbi:spx/MgsR family transcriptional regulator [Eubacterium sp. 14-2]|uniref:arsenate reductase family protein n=1 Tax=Eubacterium sp. 14-2 TaxID=1235790 RepID=UPI00033AF937|nr:arsenate reductase family protein [Eubacterium sp. 14-2]EOT28690.1 spx/MgsR family transcriptional regulator [Eubacterium sp. 14-2]